MNPIIKEFLGMAYAPEGDEIENALFRKLGEQAASDEDLEAEMDDYFEFHNNEGTYDEY